MTANEKEIHKESERKRKLVKEQQLLIKNALRSEKTIIQSKQGTIIDEKPPTDKNNNWKLVGKPYNQYVFVSVENVCETLILL